MKNYLNVGRIVYHKKNGIPAQVLELNDDSITVKLKEEIAYKSVLTLPLTHFGEWLFFSKEDLALSVEELAEKEEYEYYENAKIKEICDSVSENTKAIKRQVLERNITQLYHFTRLENYININKYGLLPMTELNKRKIACCRNDLARYDGRSDCLSLSITNYNEYVLNDFRSRYPSSEWILLSVDSKILYDNNEKYFCENNAANKTWENRLKNEAEAYELTSVESFENLFKEKVSSPNHGLLNRNDLKREKNEPTDLQAEVLYKGIIKREYIKEIIEI